METTPIRNTIETLKLCRQARSLGYPVSYTTDAAWLVNMAINRRAGWLDDPTLSRGSAMPVNGQYPKRAAGDEYRHLQMLAQRLNTPRLIVRPHEVPQWIAKRISTDRLFHE